MRNRLKQTGVWMYQMDNFDNYIPGGYVNLEDM